MRSAFVGPLCLLFSVGSVVGCGVEASEPDDSSLASITQGLVLPERSLAVTDEATLKPFTLERVMQQLVTTSGVGGVTELSLFQQWWDTQNPGPSLGMGPHCDDEMTGGAPSLNGYPWECPRAEGYQASVDPFAGSPNDHLYQPIGLFNRFDLAPANGTHCGEYRIVFGMRQGHPEQIGRNLLIFEAVMPNPDPNSGVNGCLPVAQFWYDLTTENNPDVRRKLLEAFYFNGIGGFPPAVHAEHYGTHLGDDGYGCSTGQIRTNQFVGGEWNLREFRLVKDCRCKKCFLVIVPTTTKANPFGDLFDGSSGHPAAPALHSTVIGAVGSLGTGGVNDLGWTVDNKLNSGESVSQMGGPYDYLNIFNIGAGIDPTFRDDVQNMSDMVWGAGTFSADQMIMRAQSQSCAGCHHTSNLGDIGGGTWPESLKFVHVEEVAQGGSFPISIALQKFFLPHRAQILEDFIISGGSTSPSNTKCRVPVPQELDVDCKTDASRIVTKRSFKASGLEKLKLRTAKSLGGGSVH